MNNPSSSGIGYRHSEEVEGVVIARALSLKQDISIVWRKGPRVTECRLDLGGVEGRHLLGAIPKFQHDAVVAQRLELVGDAGDRLRAEFGHALLEGQIRHIGVVNGRVERHHIGRVTPAL